MLRHLTNDASTLQLKNLVRQERTALVALLEHLAEFDERKLYADMRYPSLFAYCVRELGYSEQATAKRVYTARAVQKYPVILEMLAKTELNMAAVMVLGPHLTPTNARTSLAGRAAKAAGKLRPWSPRSRHDERSPSAYAAFHCPWNPFRRPNRPQPSLPLRANHPSSSPQPKPARPSSRYLRRLFPKKPGRP